MPAEKALSSGPGIRAIMPLPLALDKSSQAWIARRASSARLVWLSTAQSLQFVFPSAGQVRRSLFMSALLPNESGVPITQAMPHRTNPTFLLLKRHVERDWNAAFMRQIQALRIAPRLALATSLR